MQFNEKKIIYSISQASLMMYFLLHFFQFQEKHCAFCQPLSITGHVSNSAQWQKKHVQLRLLSIHLDEKQVTALKSIVKLGNTKYNNNGSLGKICAFTIRVTNHFLFSLHCIPCYALCVIFTILVSFSLNNALFASKAKINVF